MQQKNFAATYLKEAAADAAFPGLNPASSGRLFLLSSQILVSHAASSRRGRMDRTLIDSKLTQIRRRGPQARACSSCCNSAPYCLSVEIHGHVPRIVVPPPPPGCPATDFASDALTSSGLIDTTMLPAPSNFTRACPNLYACWNLAPEPGFPGPPSDPLQPGLPAQYSLPAAPNRFLFRAVDADAGETVRRDAGAGGGGGLRNLAAALPPSCTRACNCEALSRRAVGYSKISSASEAGRSRSVLLVRSESRRAARSRTCREGRIEALARGGR